MPKLFDPTRLTTRLPAHRRSTMMYRFAPSLTALLTLCACANVLPPTHVPMAVAPAWQAALPHQGSVGSLAQWWQRHGDPLLVELIVAAQAVSPSMAQALARMESTRASLTAANAALLPNLSAQASASRGVSQPAVPLATTLQGGLQTAWEIDLVGANRVASQAAQAQLEGSQALWHDARVSVAAEVANLYASYTTCTRLLALARRDAESYQDSARLSEVSAKAGFVAPSVAAMARASAAQASSRVTSQADRCELDIKALVALTAMAEPVLKEKLALAHVQQAQTAMFSIASVPAQTIAQRPDIFAAERDVVLASAQVGSAQAQAWPRLSLNGSIGNMRVGSGADVTHLATWSFGPLALSLPLLDGGQRSANVKAAQANYQAVVASYQGKVRQAVREVEEALVSLHSVNARSADAAVVSQGHAESLAAAQSSYAQGLTSLMALEDTRRSALAAESSALALVLERQRAWIALYRAAGGGFEPAVPANQAR